MAAIDNIIADFDFLDDWEDRYRYVIELGRNLETLPEEERSNANKVDGCVSQVWLWMRSDQGPDGPTLHFIGDSDAHIVRGLIAILLVLYSGQSARKILEIDALSILEQLGLRDHLSPQRSNGLASMISRIRHDAAKALSEAG